MVLDVLEYSPKISSQVIVARDSDLFLFIRPFSSGQRNGDGWLLLEFVTESNFPLVKMLEMALRVMK